MFEKAQQQRQAEFEARSKLDIYEFKQLIEASIKDVYAHVPGAAFKHHTLIEDFRKLFSAKERNFLARNFYNI